MGFIRMNVHGTVKEGRLEDFKGIARDWSINNKAKDHILAYEWFLTEDERTFQVIESFTSAEALLAHLQKASDKEAEAEQEPDYPYEMDRIEVTCDHIPDELRKRWDSSKSKIIYYSRLDGFTR